MSPYLEFEGKIIEKAVQKACETLNIPREKLKYDVISYGSSGIFGLVGVKKAKIRVVSPELPTSRNEVPLFPPEDNSFRNTEEEKPLSSLLEQPEKDAAAKTADQSEDSVNETAEPAVPDHAVAPSESSSSLPSGENSVEVGRTFLQQLLNFITTDATVTVRETSERIFFNIQGGNTAVLIGKRGQTLEAVQYIVEKVINKNTAERIRIQIDAEGYLDSRQSKLEGLAARLSEKAKRIGKPVTIGQLNAHDRRIIHIALKDDPGVRTQSMGEGFYRKLVIFPLKKSGRKKENLPFDEEKWDENESAESGDKFGEG